MQLPPPAAASSELTPQLLQFAEAPAVLLDARQLQQRVDRKHLLSRRWLPELLAGILGDYALVSSAGRAEARYRTVYFDTPGLKTFHDHRRGRRPRFKVRVRHHLDRGCSYLEIKRKGSDGRTYKARRPRAFMDEALTQEDLRYVATESRADLAPLSPVLAMQFWRVTLVSVGWAERVTIDRGLRFECSRGTASLGDAAVVEVKQPRACHTSAVLRGLRALRSRSSQASKYCIAVARLGLDPRVHAFAPVLRALRRIE